MAAGRPAGRENSPATRPASIARGSSRSMLMRRRRFRLPVPSIGSCLENSIRWLRSVAWGRGRKNAEKQQGSRPFPESRR